MTQQNINIGAAPNDGTGDPLRTAFNKCNGNFTELYGVPWVWNSGTVTVSITNSGGDGVNGPTMELYQNSASPAALDVPTTLLFSANNASAGKVTVGHIKSFLRTTTAGNESAWLEFGYRWAGTIGTNNTQYLCGYNSPSDASLEHVFRCGSHSVPYVKLESYNGTTQGVSLTIWHSSASPAIGDFPGGLAFDGMDAGNTYTNYGGVFCKLLDVAAVSKAAKLEFYTSIAASFGVRGFIASGMVLGSPTGSDKGLGTVNATAVYDDNVLLTCYPQQAAIDGAVDLDYWDSKVPNIIIPANTKKVVDKPAVWEYEVDKNGEPVMDPGSGGRRQKMKVIEPAVMHFEELEPERIVERKHEPLRKFAARLGTQYDPTKLDGQRKHQADKKHLTPYPNPEKFDEKSRPSVGAWVQSGIEMDELLFLYITQLEDQIKDLRAEVTALKTA